MADLSIRGVEPAALAELKARAEREDISVNALVLRLIDQGLGRRPARLQRRRYDDLSHLAGRWKTKEAEEFRRATAPFEEVDPALWK